MNEIGCCLKLLLLGFVVLINCVVHKDASECYCIMPLIIIIIILFFLPEVRVIPQDFKKLGITSLFWDG